MNNDGVDLLKIERALLGSLPESDLSAQELAILIREKPMFAVGRMAELTAQGYYAHAAAMVAARSAGAEKLIQKAQPNQPLPRNLVVRKNGTAHTFDSGYYLAYLCEPEMGRDLASVWLVGALLKVGDALACHGYFDHGPDLELLYHLRNGVAHGNNSTSYRKGKSDLRNGPPTIEQRKSVCREQTSKSLLH